MKKFGLITSSKNLKVNHQFRLTIFTVIVVFSCIFMSTIHCQQVEEQQAIQNQ